MKRAILLGGAALALTSTFVLAQEAPESILPPGFDDPAPAPTPAPAPRPAAPAPHPVVVRWCSPCRPRRANPKSPPRGRHWAACLRWLSWNG